MKTLANAVDSPFWDGLSDGEVKIQQCTQCDNWIWPAEYRCCECGSFDLMWKKINPAGKIYTWIRSHYPFSPGFEADIPYINILVELPHAGNMRVLGLLLDDVERVSIGDDVIAVIKSPQAQTKNLPTLCWRLADRAKE